MDIVEFTRTVATAFENADSITPQTDYRNHDEWCSIVALTVMAAVRKKYRYTLRADELRSCNSVEELYKLLNREK